MKFTTLLASATMALGLAGGALADGHAKTKVGFVYVGPVGDGGWTYEHDQGRLAVVEEFGDAVETVYVENVAEGPDAERVMTQMALEGANLIFTTSFGYMDATNSVAKKFPKVKFEHATGYKRNHPNVSTYSARFYEGRAVQGHIAGKMTKSEHRRIHRVVPDSGGDPGHQRFVYPCAQGQPGCAVQDRLGLHLV